MTTPSESDPTTRPEPQIHHLSFNQDQGRLAAGLSTSFRVYNTDPFRLLFSRSLDAPRATSTISHVSLLFRSNMIALVGGGSHPVYPPNKVMLWDDHALRCIGELSFRSEVKSVRLRRDRIVVVLAQKIFVYNFADLKVVHQIETALNPKGLCEISNASGAMLLVCLGLQKGQIRVENCSAKRSKFVMAHDSKVVCIGMSQDGRVFATASSKGTLIRVFNSLDGSLVQEVRRGADRAEIYSLAFSSNVQWLAVSSDKGTVHVFGLKIDSGSLASLTNEKSHVTSEQNHSNGRGILSLPILKGVLPKYFSSEWSVAQFRLPEGSQYFVAFGHRKNTIVIIGMDGSFYRCEFDPTNGGEMTQLEYHNFLDVDDLVEPGEAFQST